MIRSLPDSCRQFEVPTSPAANSCRKFKSKSGTRTIDLPVPLLPKFVSEGAATYHEPRKRVLECAGLTRGGVFCSHGEGAAKGAARAPAFGSRRQPALRAINEPA